LNEELNPCFEIRPIERRERPNEEGKRKEPRPQQSSSTKARSSSVSSTNRALRWGCRHVHRRVLDADRNGKNECQNRMKECEILSRRAIDLSAALEPGSCVSSRVVDLVDFLWLLRHQAPPRLLPSKTTPPPPALPPPHVPGRGLSTSSKIADERFVFVFRQKNSKAASVDHEVGQRVDPISPSSVGTEATWQGITPSPLARPSLNESDGIRQEIEHTASAPKAPARCLVANNNITPSS